MKLNMPIALVLVAAVSHCMATELGSAQAAQEQVPLFLGRLYTIADRPTIKGDVATVDAKLRDLSCRLQLKRVLEATLSGGWMLTKIDCVPSVRDAAAE